MFAQNHCFRDYALRILFRKEEVGKYGALLESENQFIPDENPEVSCDTLDTIGVDGNLVPGRKSISSSSILKNIGNMDQTNSNPVIDENNSFSESNSLLGGNSQSNVHNNYQNQQNPQNAQFSQNQPNNFQNNYQKQHQSTACQTLLTAIEEKGFLTGVIQVFDKKLAVRDRSKISSLIVLCMLPKFGLLTEILIENLSILITEAIKDGQEKSFLRQSKSVYEKMVNHWLGLLMFQNLKDTTAESLYGALGNNLKLYSKKVMFQGAF